MSIVERKFVRAEKRRNGYWQRFGLFYRGKGGIVMFSKGLRSRRGALLVGGLLLIGLVSVQTAARDFVFSGHVYQGSPPDTSQHVVSA